MSRYVVKKHGITIGSANLFFHRDQDGEMRYYPCIVSVASLAFDHCSTLHAGIRSVAEQLLFTPIKVRDPLDGFDRTMYRLRTYWLKWLEENCPGYGYPPPKYSDRVPSLFFARRKDALAFYNHVDELLKGQTYL